LRYSVADPQSMSFWLADQAGSTVYQFPYSFSTATFGTTASETLEEDAGTAIFGMTTWTDAAATRHITALRSDGPLYDTAGNTTVFAPITPVIKTPLAAPLAVDAIASDGSALYVLGNSEQILRSTDGGGSFAVLHDDPSGGEYENRSVVARGNTIVVDRGSG